MPVSDIPDHELLKRAVTNARPIRAAGKQPRWVAIMDTFGLGSSYSSELCQRFGLDPDEKVKR